MYLKFRNYKDVLIVDFVGEVDHHYASEIKVKVDYKIERERISKVILNFEDVTFMDSSGIGTVVGRYKKMKARDGYLCIANIKSTVKRVFELSGLFKIIDTYEDVEEALKYLMEE